MITKYKDFAIILTWPDATIRGDEKWMMFFKKIGLVKNLNFKVGHTGIILVNHKDGAMTFYDFGRYITPRGHGRARSEYSDPLLKINLKAKLNKDSILNIEEIVSFLEHMKAPMYGEGKLYYTVVNKIDHSLAKAYGDECVKQGTYPYGAVARNNNNCSRFITRMLIKSTKEYHLLHPINFPETIKASPVSNLVNTASDRMIYSYTPSEGVRHFKMNRYQSLWFLIKQIGDNISRSKASKLPNDQIIGAMKYYYQPNTIPIGSIYLGGVGDGAWYHTQIRQENLIIKRYTTKGILEYSVLAKPSSELNLNEKFEVTYDSNLLFTHVIQNSKKIRIEHLRQIEESKVKVKKERIYA